MELRLEFNKLGTIKFISHLDTIRLFQRAFMRAEIPILWSEGYNPHPKMSIATPLSLGVESESETLDIEVEDSYNFKLLKDQLNKVLPKGIQIIQVTDEFDPTSMFQRVNEAEYELFFSDIFDINKEDLLQAVGSLRDADQVLVSRKRKRGNKKIMVKEDIIPLINSLDVKENRDGVYIYARISASSSENLRPDRLIAGLRQVSTFDFDADLVQIKRLRSFDETGSEIHV